MNRRAFFKEVAGSVQRAADTPAPPAEKPDAVVVPTAGSPRQYAVGARVLVTDAQAWLCCDEIGFYAVDAVCPHLGCMVRWVAERFVCPCHHSTFSMDGMLETGPAPHGLRYLYVDLDHDGNLIIRRDKTTSPEDRLIA